MVTLLLVAVTMIVSLTITPIVIAISKRLNLVDKPNFRKVHTKPISVMGGTVILFSFLIGIWIGHPIETEIKPLIIGAIIMYVLGLVDDIYDLKPYIKLAGQIAAALVVAFYGVTIDFISLPMGTTIHFGFLSIPITVIWIVAITNAVNLIDGLDGLVSGVSIISLVTMGIVSYFFLPVPNLFLTMTIFVLVASIAGFFPFNYHPAILYLGDTGALFIGFMISVLSLQGLKNATAVAVVTPMIILGVPITDTFLAIIRRTLSGQKFYKPDRNHLHHRLLSLGLTHRGTVLVIYGISMIFSLISLLLNISSRIGGVLLVIGLLFGVELLAELIGVLGPHHSPLLNVLRYIGNSSYREEVRQKRKEKTK